MNTKRGQWRLRASGIIGLWGFITATGWAQELPGGMFEQTHEMAFYGYVYVPSCEVNLAQFSGPQLTSEGGVDTLTFTEMSGLRWSQAKPDDVLQTSNITLRLTQCSLTQLTVRIQTAGPDEGENANPYWGLMQYDGVPKANVPESRQATQAYDVKWQDELGVKSREWLYYSVGLGDANVSGAHAATLPLVKQDAQCTTSEECFVKLDNTAYHFTREVRQAKRLNDQGVWAGDWTDPASSLDSITNRDPAGYLPSNYVEQSTIYVPFTVRLHRGQSTKARDEVPLGNYRSTLTINLAYE